eukprot:g2902.t1
MRHGARTPCNGGNRPGIDPKKQCWPGDDIEFTTCSARQTWTQFPAKDETPTHRLELNLVKEEQNEWRGNCGVGEMTDSGVRQCENNGKRLAEAYGRYLLKPPSSTSSGAGAASPSPDANAFFVSDDSARVMECGKEVAGGMGLFRNLTWHVVGPSSGLASAKEGCPSAQRAVARFWRESEFIQRAERKYPDLLPELRATLGEWIVGHEVADLSILPKVMDCVHGHLCPTVAGSRAEVDRNAGKMPATLREKILPLLVESGLAAVKYKEFYEEVDVLDGEVVYMGHDLSPLGPLLGFFGAVGLPPVKQWPSFASMLVVELGEEKVRLLYDNEVLPTRMCGETGICDRSLFFEKLRELLPTDEECGRVEEGGSGEHEGDTLLWQ